MIPMVRHPGAIAFFSILLGCAPPSSPVSPVVLNVVIEIAVDGGHCQAYLAASDLGDPDASVRLPDGRPYQAPAGCGTIWP
jgi:hypothetical protein